MANLRNTRFGAEKISELLNGGRRIFFVGIGGISMCSLAISASKLGYEVSGSDREESDTTRALADDGITVLIGHRRENIIECEKIKADMLVYTVSVPAENPEYKAACEAGIPRVSRADFLGWLMHGYNIRIGISGMHGKSTATGMTASILLAADCDPTISSGAVLPELGRSYRSSASREYFLYEACEYKDSFLSFYPTISVILNIDMDHPDYFYDIEAVKYSFRRCLARTRDLAVVNFGDPVIREVCGYYDKSKLIKLGTALDGCPLPRAGFDFFADDIELLPSRSRFCIYKRGELYAVIELKEPGAHNVRNALAAAAAADAGGISAEFVKRGLESFTGAKRRMEYKGKTAAGADLYLDYAHHPTEIAATLETARLSGRRVTCVFQPHTYSRLRSLLDGFASSLAIADAVVTADVYAARETNTLGMSAQLLTDKINAAGGSAIYLGGDFGRIAEYVSLPAFAAREDILIVMGAGDISRVSDIICQAM